MNNKTIGVLLMVLAVLGFVGTAWLAAFIPEKYGLACVLQGLVFIAIGISGMAVFSETKL